MNSSIKFNRILLLTCAVAFCLAALPGAAWADITIYNNGAPDHGGTYYADANNLFTMDASSFMLVAGSSTITDATWWGGCFPGPTCQSPADLTIAFYTDVAGAPGSVIQSYSVGNANQTATGTLINGGFDEYVYSASFGPLALVPGTTYFFVVENDTTAGDWGQETAGGVSHEQYCNGSVSACAPFTPGWNSFPDSLAFNLSGPSAVPEPTSILLFATVFLGIGAGLKRKLR